MAVSNGLAASRLGPPELIERHEIVRLSYATEYRVQLVRDGSRPRYVFLKDPEAEPTGPDRYALVQLAGVRRVLLLRPIEDGGWSAAIDLNADGVLDEDEWRELRDQGERLRVEGRATSKGARGKGLPFRFEIDLREDGGLRDQGDLFRRVRRTGSVRIAGRPLRIQLTTAGSGFGGVDVRLDVIGEEPSVVVEGATLWVDGRAYGFVSNWRGDRLRFRERSLDPGVVPPLLVGDVVPGFTATTRSGQSFEFLDTRGEWTLIYFWGTWCKPCVDDVAGWVGLAEAYRDDGFRIVSINVGDEPGVLDRYLATHGIDWIVIPGGRDGALTGMFRVRQFPTSLLVGPDGRVVAQRVGPAEALAILAERLPGYPDCRR
ncbi:MAG: TlpA family protein disulfide reductase [Acidobacteriota bacterium]|nr:TlpA family protein disulfide reductase [Acidobacteriota bacterium]